ncbi:phage protein NinX family protein [uncultured Gilliamella sp.]|uniref:phage protein NinX family protein n=1 Tax=uncultured Gilliamella sp. TaxID=1193505 RepID=UPI0025EDEAD1|nr:phage protein NinX family protein [uncultured Gilliamella sp.]
MTKYSELSNFEINKLIADAEGYAYEIGIHLPSSKPQNIQDYQYINKKVTMNEKFWAHIDYCQFGKDAFNLMIENGISLISHSKNSNGVTFYSAVSDFAECKIHVDHENPCRAIAECYLLMKDECINDIELGEKLCETN